MQGYAAPYPRLLHVTLEHDHRKSKGRPELARAQLTRDAQGGLNARLHARQGSGSLPSIAAVDALVLLPAEQTQIPAGAALQALLIGAPPELPTPGFT
jgi:molybdopterin biosynthesis enzyme